WVARARRQSARARELLRAAAAQELTPGSLEESPTTRARHASPLPLPDGLAQRAAGQPSLLEVALVILLRAPEARGRRDVGHDGPPKARLRSPERGPCRRLLLGVVEEDHRPILASEVPALAVPGRRVVDP